MLKIICYLPFKFKSVSSILSGNHPANINLQTLVLLGACVVFPPGSDFVLVSLGHAGIAGF